MECKKLLYIYILFDQGGKLDVWAGGGEPKDAETFPPRLVRRRTIFGIFHDSMPEHNNIIQMSNSSYPLSLSLSLVVFLLDTRHS